MLDKVLVPLDLSELSSRILPAVRRLVGDDGAREVVLLHVLGDVDPGDEVAYRAVFAPARAKLLELEEELIRGGTPASHLIVRGDPAEQILAAEQAEGASLLAMATHGRSGVARWVRGSVAERVLRRACAPLLLVNPVSGQQQAKAFRRILVPLDGSEASAGILLLVESFARRFGSEVLLLAVENFSAPGAPHWKLRESEEVERILLPYRDRLRRAGIPQVRVLTRTGPEADQILDVVDNEAADLVAMSTHGRSGLSRWWFGSVAEAVLRACTAPLLVKRTAGFCGQERDRQASARDLHRTLEADSADEV